MYYYGSTEQDEKISRHPTVSPLLKLFSGSRCYKAIWGSGIRSWNNHSVNDFPEERGSWCSGVPVSGSVCPFKSQLPPKYITRRTKKQWIKPNFKKKKLKWKSFLFKASIQAVPKWHTPPLPTNVFLIYHLQYCYKHKDTLLGITAILLDGTIYRRL